MIRRKIFLINPRFQLRFLAYMVGITFLAIAVFYGANLYFFAQFAQKGRTIGLPPEHIFFRFLDEQRRSMNLIFILTSAVLLMAMCAAGLFFSHRVAGPLYKFRKHLEDLTAGSKSTEVRFRKNDHFQEIADAFNEFIKSRK